MPSFKDSLKSSISRKGPKKDRIKEVQSHLQFFKPILDSYFSENATKRIGLDSFNMTASSVTAEERDEGLIEAYNVPVIRDGERTLLIARLTYRGTDEDDEPELSFTSEYSAQDALVSEWGADTPFGREDPYSTRGHVARELDFGTGQTYFQDAWSDLIRARHEVSEKMLHDKLSKSFDRALIEEHITLGWHADLTPQDNVSAYLPILCNGHDTLLRTSLFFGTYVEVSIYGAITEEPASDEHIAERFDILIGK